MASSFHLTRTIRLTWHTEANKLCMLFCDNASVAIAFTELAAVDKFRTQDWLRDTLYNIGNNVHTLEEILAEFQLRASRTFSKLTGQPQAIAFLISGFRYSKHAENVCYLMSNSDPEAPKIKAGNNLKLHTLGTAGSVIVEAAKYPASEQILPHVPGGPSAGVAAYCRLHLDFPPGNDAC